MRAIEEQLRALERLDALRDEKARDAKRDTIHAALRAAFRADAATFRAFLHGRDICDQEQALAASALVEALAGGEAAEMQELRSYFEVAERQAARCPENEDAVQVLTSYAFLEQGSGKQKLDMLPQYVALSRSTVTALRRAALDLFGGFQVASAPGVRDALVQMLRDPDWRIRRGAEELLREEGVLPAGHAPSLLDRLRRLFSS